MGGVEQLWLFVAVAAVVKNDDIVLIEHVDERSDLFSFVAEAGADDQKFFAISIEKGTVDLFAVLGFDCDDLPVAQIGG